MPLAPKRNLNDPFNCPSCTQVFQTRGGLSQHYRIKHRIASSPLTDICEVDLRDNDTIPFPETVGVPPDIAQIACSQPQIIIGTSSPVSSITPIISNILGEKSSANNLRSPSPARDTELQDSSWEFQFSGGLHGLPEDNNFTTDSDTDTEDTDLDTPVDSRVRLTKLPDMLKFGDALPHPNAGHIYDIPGQESHGLKIQEQDHRRFGHPYHPWCSENELWLSNFIFFKAKMSISMADVMMEGIRDGRLRIDGLNISRARKMLSIIDDGAKYIPVRLITLVFFNLDVKVRGQLVNIRVPIAIFSQNNFTVPEQ